MENTNTENLEVVETPQEIMAPEMQAAQYLMGAIPAFRSLLNGVTGVQAKNVLMSIIESPLEQTVSKFTTKEANSLFNLGLMIESQKFLLFNTGLNSEEMVEQVNEQMVEEANKEQV